MADKNFLTEIIDADLAEGKISEIHTRFPPEPNGYLHIGSAKAIYINWSIANQYGGKFNLRLDDTNPAREGEEYVNSIIEDLHWLGADPNGGIFYGSDYFDKCYEYAEKLILEGKAYVDDLTVGSDVFLNCFALADLLVRAAPEEKTGLFALVNNITEAVRALFWLPGEARPRAGLWYPAYWEDVEESPAHILLHTFSGQGYHYRQCFLDGKILSAEYDAIFPDGHAAEDQGVAAMLCFDRLRWPWNLTEKAKDPYREFLASHTGLVLQRLLKAQDTDSIKDLLALDVLDAAAFAEGAALAAKAARDKQKKEA